MRIIITFLGQNILKVYWLKILNENKHGGRFPRRFGDLVSLFCKLLENYLPDFEISKKRVTAIQIVHKLEDTSFFGGRTPSYGLSEHPLTELIHFDEEVDVQ